METNLHVRFMLTLDNIVHVGASPAVSTKLLQLTENKETSANEIANLIATDQAIAAQVLRLANTAHYYRGYPITTIKQALLTLGFETIRSLVLAVEMIGMYPGTRSNPDFDYVKFWKHTLTGAHIAQTIGTQFENEGETFYTAALLRNFGVLIIRQHFTDVFDQISKHARSNEVPFNRACVALGVSDPKLFAYKLFTKWNIPNKVLFTFHKPEDVGVFKYDKILLTKNAVTYVDNILKIKDYCQWDPFYTMVPIEDKSFTFNTEELETIFNETSQKTEEFCTAIGW